jgi:hypothetical protein
MRKTTNFSGLNLNIFKRVNDLSHKNC